MGFGIDAGISRNTNYSSQVAEKMDEVGTIDEFSSYGSTSETTEEVYVDAASFANEATNDQQGTTVVTAHSLIESNTEYARASKTSRAALPATTTT
tara:strand:+ start:13944 stop:14231 length:288 start_codon:yes stop_codon:yes gene_type:complete